jgi:hypothetical protein
MLYSDNGATDEVPSPLLKWSAVFGGLVLGLAMLLLLSSLWLALAFGSNIDAIRSEIEWYIGVSAVVSLFAAGILTGYLSGVRGAVPGMLQGFTLWGLLMLLTITVGVPSLLNVFGLERIANETGTGTLTATGDGVTLWVTFWTLLGGFIAAGLGGVIGGLSTRAESRTPAAVVMPQTVVTDPAPRGYTAPVRRDTMDPDEVVVEEDQPTTRSSL